MPATVFHTRTALAAPLVMFRHPSRSRRQHAAPQALSAPLRALAQNILAGATRVASNCWRSRMAAGLRCGKQLTGITVDPSPLRLKGRPELPESACQPWRAMVSVAAHPAPEGNALEPWSKRGSRGGRFIHLLSGTAAASITLHSSVTPFWAGPSLGSPSGSSLWSGSGSDNE